MRRNEPKRRTEVTGLADRRLHAAIRERAREGERRRMRDDELHLVDLLAGALDTGTERVTLTLVDGASITGIPSIVARHGVVLDLPDRRAIVAMTSVSAVRSPAAASKRERSIDHSLATLVAATIGPGDIVRVTSGANRFDGRVRVVGADLLSVELVDGATVHVAIDRIDLLICDSSDDEPMRHDSTNDRTSERLSLITRPNR